MPKFTERNSIKNEIGLKTTGKMARALVNNNYNAGTDSKIRLREIPVGDITPRFTNRYSQRGIDDLARSIRNTDGRLIHPIIVVDWRDLPEDSDILKDAKEIGADIRSSKYIIVAGERRYRAWLKLKAEEAERIKDKLGAVNRYDTITANILTTLEARNEKTYYTDSNDKTRHVEAGDVIWYIKDILKGLQTDEEKFAALNEMEFQGNIDKAMKPRQFPTHLYIAYRLKKDKGIDDWTEGTVKNQLRIAQNCSDKVADALLSGKFPNREAKIVVNYPADIQDELLAVYDESPEKYTARIEELKKNAETKQIKKHSTHGECRRYIKASLKKIKTDRRQIGQLVSALADSNNTVEEQVLERYDRLIADIEEIIEKAK